MRRPQAAKPEPVTLPKIVGLTLFVLFMYATIFYALPVVLEGLR